MSKTLNPLDCGTLQEAYERGLCASDPELKQDFKAVYAEMVRRGERISQLETALRQARGLITAHGCTASLRHYWSQNNCGPQIDLVGKAIERLELATATIDAALDEKP